MAETGSTYQATVRPVAPAPPQFGAPSAPAPAAKPASVTEPEPDAGQPALFGAPAAPAAPPPKPEPTRPASRPEPPAQPVLLSAPPQGTYTQRFGRVMALRKKATPEAIAELAAALGDEDERIRWLAGSVLQSIGGGMVIATLRAFIDQAPSAVAREEAVRVLGKLEERGG